MLLPENRSEPIYRLLRFTKQGNICSISQRVKRAKIFRSTRTRRLDRNPRQNTKDSRQVRSWAFIIYRYSKKRGLKKRIAKHLLRTPRVSTIRYSLAALAGFKAQKFSSKYTVNKTDNDFITNWLKEHTYFKIYECANDLVESLEDKYIEKYIPPLNIFKNPQILSCVSSAREKFRASATINL